MVRNANKLEKLVKKKEGLQNWLDYYENKQARHPELLQTTKVVVSSCIYLLENEFKGLCPSISDMWMNDRFIDGLSWFMGDNGECGGLLQD